MVGMIVMVCAPWLPPPMCRRRGAVHPSPPDAPAAPKRMLKRDCPDMLYTTLPFVLWSSLVRHTCACACAWERHAQPGLTD